MRTILLTATLLLATAASSAPKAESDLHISKAALPGQEVRLWFAALVNPDCSSAGTMTTEVMEPPSHGKVRISDDPVYPGFQPPNPRAVCDSQQVPGKQAFYTPAADFHGHDRLVLRNATSEGRIRRLVIDVSVP